MNSTRILVRAPSNIAIIKYMGKRDSERNIPANPSFSMTLSDLCTFVEIRVAGSGGIRFVSEVPAGLTGPPPKLDAVGEKKFVDHYRRVSASVQGLLKARGIEPMTDGPIGIEIRSMNTFPESTGIASSASSFAALTLASAGFVASDQNAFRTQYERDPILRRRLAELSREGSGSSCRSFEGPFVAWEGEHAERVAGGLPPMADVVVVVSKTAKRVTSSEAHRRAKTSSSWPGRAERAGERFTKVCAAISRGDFKTFSEVANADFRDMHALFESAEAPFTYFTEGTSEVLEFLESEPGIAITMDAGPNVHVLLPQTEAPHLRDKLTKRFPKFSILVDRQGSGAEILG